MYQKMNSSELKAFMDEKADFYNHPRFIETDPIQIPHRFTLKEDIEISGFLAATIAWGNRKMIIQNAHKMIQMMGNSPYDFIISHSKKELEKLDHFVHRTFNGDDFKTFIIALQNIYKNHGGMETVFSGFPAEQKMHQSIHEFRNLFFEIEHNSRTQKHLSDPMKNSASKRLHMFLRWMVRNDNKGVDLGIWKKISPAQLSCPLDVHTGNIARKLGLLERKQNDGKALEELDNHLRKFDINDPVKYDFALFGLGVFEKF
jgi:uncharacterized protein (TIGR02757 family)